MKYKIKFAKKNTSGSWVGPNRRCQTRRR